MKQFLLSLVVVLFMSSISQAQSRFESSFTDPQSINLAIDDDVHPTTTFSIKPTVREKPQVVYFVSLSKLKQIDYRGLYSFVEQTIDHSQNPALAQAQVIREQWKNEQVFVIDFDISKNLRLRITDDKIW